MHVINEFNLNKAITIRLITNGSYMTKPSVQDAWKQITKVNKEIWFKIDSVSNEDTKIINQVNSSLNLTSKNIESAIKISPTIIQTCVIKINGELPSNESINKYIAFIKKYEKSLNGIHLYSLARPTEQKITPKIERLTEEELMSIATKIKKLDLPVSAYV